MPDKVTFQEMLDALNRVYSRWGGMSTSEMAEYEAIRSLIENMDKKVSREFVEKWVKRWIQDDSNFIERELKYMLTELGHEVKEKEGSGEPK